MTRPAPARGSYRVARVLGIDIRLHWTFLVLVAVIVWAGRGVGAAAAGVAWLAVVFGSVLLHELAHCVVARRRGARVDDVLLTPIGGISRLHDLPERPQDELAVAIVGPLTSAVLAAAALGAGAAAGADVWPPTLLGGSWPARVGWFNALLAAFNLLPALPMDGGRVLRAALARRHDRATATRIAADVARVLAVAMIVAGLVVDIWLVLIGAFVYLGAAAEEEQARRGGPPPGTGTTPAGGPPGGGATHGRSP